MPRAEPEPSDQSAATSGARSAFVTVFALGLTQIIGWGSSFSSLAILGQPIGRDLAIPREVVFAGMTIMLIVAGVISPAVGRRVDRDGPRTLMMAGSLTMVAALLVMSVANGAYVYGFAWMLFGLAMPMALGTTSTAACVQIAGAQARRAVTGLVIVAGLTSFFFLPLSSYLEANYGWRGALRAFALLHLIVALPIHALVLPKTRPNVTAATSQSKDTPWDGTLPEPLARRVFWLLVAWSCLEGMLVWGFNLQAVDLLHGLGLTRETAIAVWMLSAPSQSISRIVEFSFGGRFPIILTGVVSAAMAPLGFLILYLGGMTATAAALMAVAYGIGHGLFAIARNVLPLRLFGMRRYGEISGRLAMPQNIANGAAPILFAALLSRGGSEIALLCAAGCAIVSLLAVLMLWRSVETRS